MAYEDYYPPCRNCITLAICKSDSNKYKMFSTIVPKCQLVRDYLGIFEWSPTTFTSRTDDVNYFDIKIEIIRKALLITHLADHHVFEDGRIRLYV